jgi:hypothetical protein
MPPDFAHFFRYDKVDYKKECKIIICKINISLNIFLCVLSILYAFYR